VALDQDAAFWWFRRAADQADAEAMNMVGRCHEHGWGTPLDLLGAAARYRASAERHHDWGQYNLGNLLFDGRGVARDPGQALTWYLRASRRGHARAMNLLGRCLEQGWGCARSPGDALHWYRQSAHAGYFRGQFNYAAVLAERGLAVAAAAWFWQAARCGNAPIRRAIAGVLSASQDPALIRVRQRVAAL
jgi:hypothetical protein